MGADPHLGKFWNQENWKGRVAIVLGHDVRGISEAVRGTSRRVGAIANDRQGRITQCGSGGKRVDI